MIRNILSNLNKKIALFSLLGLLSLSLIGCIESDLSGNTYEEPEITVDYLVTEFANQITRDGAEKRFGVIENVHDNEDGTYKLTVSGKQFVNDSTQPNGFYIADRNIDYDLTLSKNVRSVIFPSGNLEDGQFFLNGTDFTHAFGDGFSDFQEESSKEARPYYFYFYVMHDNVELIVQQYVP